MDYGAILAAVVAAAVAIMGYLIGQHGIKRERKAKFFAEAILAVKEFEELPYRIAKRADCSAETRERVGSMVNNAYVKLSFYTAWLRIDSPRVVDAYACLMRRAIQFGESQQTHAWGAPIICEDLGMDLGERYYYGTEPELKLCEKVMRRELSVLAPLLAGVTRREIVKHQAWRSDMGQPIQSYWTDVENGNNIPVRLEGAPLRSGSVEGGSGNCPADNGGLG